MKANQETMKAIAEGMRTEEMCPIIDEIARQVALSFELTSESIFENDEDEIIFDLIMRLFASGNYMEAVDVLTLSFSLTDVTEAYEITALIANTGRDNVYRQFLQRFISYSGRHEVKHVDVRIVGELS